MVELEENRNYEGIIDDYNENIEYEQYNQMKVEVIMTLIQKLSPMYKIVFNLYVFEELSHKEIAEQLNINIGTSKSINLCDSDVSVPTNRCEIFLFFENKS